MTKVVLDAPFLMIQMVIHGQRSPPKRIFKPRSVAVLKKQVNQAFKPPRPIRSFLHTDGTVIQTLDDLESGTLIIASFRRRKDHGKPELTYEEIEEMDFMRRGQVLSGNVSTVTGRRPTRRGPSLRGGPSSFGPKSVWSSEWGSFDWSQSRRNGHVHGQILRDSGKRSHQDVSDLKGLALYRLLNSFITDEQVLRALGYMIDSCDKKDMLMKLFPLEEEQSHAWLKAIVSQPVLTLAREVVVYDEVKRHVTDLIRKHRFLIGKWADHRMRLAVTGPRRSGKSILLAEIASQFASEMVITGEWKSTFIFAFDVLQFLPCLTNYPALLELMVNQVFDAIAGQKPSLLESVQSLKKKFGAILTIGVIEPSASARTPFDAIARQISELWRDNDAFFAFFSVIFQLPILLAKAAGFENVFMVADNFDRADVQLSAAPPFAKQANQLFFAELLKYALDATNFAVACEDTPHFLQVMAPTDDEGIDLLEGMYIDSTMDIGNPASHKNRSDRLAVHIDGDELPVNLHVELCGGVIHFLEKWKALCNLASRVHLRASGTASDDVQFAALAAASEFVELVFDQSSITYEVRITNIVHLPDKD
jgi:hypothetical protein